METKFLYNKKMDLFLILFVFLYVFGVLALTNGNPSFLVFSFYLLLFFILGFTWNQPPKLQNLQWKKAVQGLALFIVMLLGSYFLVILDRVLGNLSLLPHLMITGLPVIIALIFLLIEVQENETVKNLLIFLTWLDISIWVLIMTSRFIFPNASSRFPRLKFNVEVVSKNRTT